MGYRTNGPAELTGERDYKKAFEYFSKLMDAGKLLKVKISKISQKGSFKQISVGIFLVDL